MSNSQNLNKKNQKRIALVVFLGRLHLPNGILRKNAISAAIEKFGFSAATIKRIWKRARDDVLEGKDTVQQVQW